MSTQGRRIVSVGGDVDNDPYFNPFASSSQSSFSSAVKPKDGLGARPAFRRRGSDSSAMRRHRNNHDPWEEALAASGNVHVRARTLDATVGASTSSAKSHPLAPRQSASGAGSSSSSFTDTRPRLKRLLSDLGSGPDRNGGPLDGDGGERTSPPQLSNAALKEKVVIVHEVSHKDSLAGVALKYGISMADLRKANQLWASDPIHLRKVLYIPLDRSHKATELVLSQLESSTSSVVSTDPDPSIASSSNSADRTPTLASASPLTIRRVPLSQLSFFPPPSSSSVYSPPILSSSRTLPRITSSASTRKRDPIPFDVTPSSSSAHSADTSSSLPSTSAFASALQAPPSPTPPRAPLPSLTSLFNALPIGRISFDSGTSTPSQTSEDQEHELDDVSRPSSAAASARQRALIRQAEYTSVFGTRAPSGHPKRTDGVELAPFASPSGSRGSASRVKGTKLSETPRTQKTIHYLSPERHSPAPDFVRTSQLEPSPVMQLPLKSKRDQQS